MKSRSEFFLRLTEDNWNGGGWDYEILRLESIELTGLYLKDKKKIEHKYYRIERSQAVIFWDNPDDPDIKDKIVYMGLKDKIVDMDLKDKSILPPLSLLFKSKIGITLLSIPVLLLIAGILIFTINLVNGSSRPDDLKEVPSNSQDNPVKFKGLAKGEANGHTGYFKVYSLEDTYTWECDKKTVVKDSKNIEYPEMINHAKTFLTQLDNTKEDSGEDYNRPIEVILIGPASQEGQSETEFLGNSRDRSQQLSTWFKAAHDDLKNDKNYNFLRISDLISANHLWRLNVGKYQGKSVKSCKEQSQTSYQRQIFVAGLVWKSSPVLSNKENLEIALRDALTRLDIETALEPFKFDKYQCFELLGQQEEDPKDTTLEEVCNYTTNG